MNPTVSRRSLFPLPGRGVLGAAAGLTAGLLGHDALAGPATERQAESETVPFYGERQSGITTPAQDRLHIAAFDVITADREELIRLLKDWTEAAAAMTAGREAGATGAVNGPYDAPPEDTGEAIGTGCGPADTHLRFRTDPLRKGRQGQVRVGGPQARGPYRPAAFPGRPAARPADRWGSRGAGLLRRPAGRRACHPEPRPDRLRQGTHPLVPARFRTYVLHLPGPADTPAISSASKTAPTT